MRLEANFCLTKNKKCVLAWLSDLSATKSLKSCGPFSSWENHYPVESSKQIRQLGSNRNFVFFCLGEIGFKCCELMSVTKVHSVCGLKQWSRPQISIRHLISIIWSQFISRPNIRLQVSLLTNDNGLSKLQKPPRYSYRWPNNAIVILAIVIFTMPQGWLLIWVQCLTIECWRLGHRGCRLGICQKIYRTEFSVVRILHPENA